MVVLCVLKFGHAETVELICDSIEDYPVFGKTCFLEDLIISNGDKQSYTFSSDYRHGEVKTVTIGSSTLDHIPADFKKAFPKFDTLSLSDCSVTVADGTFFKDAGHLKSLYADEVNLRELKSDFFAPLKDLESLSLIGCNIENLTSSDLFSNNKKLNTISLEKNGIDYISPLIFKSSKMINVKILENCVETNLSPANFKNFQTIIKNCSDSFLIKEVEQMQHQMLEMPRKIEDLKQSLQGKIKKTDDKLEQTDKTIKENAELVQDIGTQLKKAFNLLSKFLSI